MLYIVLLKTFNYISLSFQREHFLIVGHTVENMNLLLPIIINLFCTNSGVSDTKNRKWFIIDSH